MSIVLSELELSPIPAKKLMSGSTSVSNLEAGSFVTIEAGSEQIYSNIVPVGKVWSLTIRLSIEEKDI